LDCTMSRTGRMDMTMAFLYTPRSARACKPGEKDRELVHERLEGLQTLSSVTDLRLFAVD
jgi:hypothetical protein